MPTMCDTDPVLPFDDEEHPPVHYASFILRCWSSDAGHLRARLIDVNSGVSRPVADLAELPALVGSLLAQIPPSQDGVEESDVH